MYKFLMPVCSKSGWLSASAKINDLKDLERSWTALSPFCGVWCKQKWGISEASYFKKAKDPYSLQV